jgi:hypothetical protein
MATLEESWIVFTLMMTTTTTIDEREVGRMNDGCQQVAVATRQALSSVALLTHGSSLKRAHTDKVIEAPVFIRSVFALTMTMIFRQQ